MDSPPLENPIHSSSYLNGLQSSSSTKKMPRLGQSVHKVLNNLMLPRQAQRTNPFQLSSCSNSANKLNLTHKSHIESIPQLYKIYP